MGALRWIPAFAGMTFILGACTTAQIVNSVPQPIGGAASSSYFLAPPEVTSLEQDAEHVALNRQWGALITKELETALGAAGKTFSSGSRDAIQSKVRVVYERTRIKTENGIRRMPGFVEVRLQWVNLDGGGLRYANFTKASLDPGPFAQWFGWGETRDEAIARTLRAAAEHFARGLGASTAAPSSAEPVPVPAPAPTPAPVAEPAPATTPAQ